MVVDSSGIGSVGGVGILGSIVWEKNVYSHHYHAGLPEIFGNPKPVGTLTEMIDAAMLYMVYDLVIILDIITTIIPVV